ncbi:hypothetical protein [Bauldia litoralis]|uniref:Sigma-70 region 2 n=1 Tax=Bauldia litoralis TaxID=665467 RepID=A0A1G6BI61_9HYPH|nr:hypothetical protein [Bauldia litoralis]SDB20273.1 hypothetical protein SAMN02982931_01479 [Bauldia litoralis]
METTNTSGLDGRVFHNIRFNARKLARQEAVPGMTVEDYEQDLAADLVRRSQWFDRDRASFATFADRVIAHRATTLTTPTERLREERLLLSLDAPAVGEDGSVTTLLELLPNEAPPIDESVAAHIDVCRFVEGLTAPLVDGCRVLLAGSISAGARDLGIHRSTASERVRAVRAAAAASGLRIYAPTSSDGLALPPVCGEQGATLPMAIGAEPEPMPMPSHLPRPHPQLLVTELDLTVWLASADRGETLEYHRGVLAIDRLALGSRLPKEDARELDRVAKAAMSAVGACRAYLMQRRHGDGDYSYLIVARSRPALFARPRKAREFAS